MTTPLVLCAQCEKNEAVTYEFDIFDEESDYMKKIPLCQACKENNDYNNEMMNITCDWGR